MKIPPEVIPFKEATKAHAVTPVPQENVSSLTIRKRNKIWINRIFQ